jgi:hypothetical protein
MNAILWCFFGNFNTEAGEGWRPIGPIVCEMKKYHRVKKESNILHTINKRRLAGHILHRNCPIQLVIKGNIEGGTEMTGRGRRRKQLLGD